MSMTAESETNPGAYRDAAIKAVVIDRRRNSSKKVAKIEQAPYRFRSELRGCRIYRSF